MKYWPVQNFLFKNSEHIALCKTKHSLQSKQEMRQICQPSKLIPHQFDMSSFIYTFSF